ncbi:MAG: hypothetical protein ACREQN_11620, partial [Candidatus Binataceae bacterium]
MASRPLKRIDILRHELKALRFILDNYHSGKFEGSALPPRDDFQAAQCRQIYDIVMQAPSRIAAEARIGAMEFEDVDIESFLRLSGDHYYTDPALVRQRAEA